MVDLSTSMGTGGEAMGDTLRNIELVWGSEHDDTFIASNGADISKATAATIQCPTKPRRWASRWT